MVATIVGGKGAFMKTLGGICEYSEGGMHYYISLIPVLCHYDSRIIPIL